MQKLDPHTLFSIFEKGDEEIYKENNIEELLDNPYVLIGMVVTGVENFYMIDQMYMVKHEEDYLNELLIFFENIEHYEKCGKIKQYTDLLIGRKLEELV